MVKANRFWQFVIVTLLFIPSATAHSYRTPFNITGSELRQLSAALEQYRIEHNQFPPPINTPPYRLAALVESSTSYLKASNTDYFAKPQSIKLSVILGRIALYLLIVILPIGILMLPIVQIIRRTNRTVAFVRTRLAEFVFLLVPCALWFMFLWSNYFFERIDFSYFWLFCDSLEKPIGVEYSYYYALTQDGHALIGSPGADFTWQLDRASVLNTPLERIPFAQILYEPSNGMLSSGDMILIVKKR